MIKTEQKLGLSGEFQIIVRRADGSIKFDTGMQPNLVLDNGIKHYLGLPMVNNSGKQQTTHINGFMNYCYVGSGNKLPQKTDVALQNMVARHVGTRDWVFGKDEPDTGKHEGFVKTWKRGKYVFDNINNQNITEVGLAAWQGSESIDGVRYDNAYTLVTRALIKDSGGTPITVTVLQGEILEVIYQINIYVDIKRKTGSFTLTTTKDGQDTTDTFDYFLQPHTVSSGNAISNYLMFDKNYHGVASWGVKETDTELTGSYALDDTDYKAITHNDTSKLAGKTSGNKTSSAGASKYQDGYIESSITEQSFETGRVTVKVVNGIYSHIHTNGIRAFQIAQGYGSTYKLVHGLVVLKNRANGQGIKKTNRQLWEFTHSYILSRWGE